MTPLYWEGKPVPYITQWSAEEVWQAPVRRHIGIGGAGLGYVDEHSADRVDGALWLRASLAPGRGRPDFNVVHPLRQRRAMRRLLCQVCATEAEDPTGRCLWLIHTAGAGGEDVLQQETDKPPVCRRCAPLAVEMCPWLRKGHLLTWVTHTLPWGVHGTVHDERTLQPIPTKNRRNLTRVACDDPLIRWTVAAHDVVTLHGCEPTTLDALART